MKEEYNSRNENSFLVYAPRVRGYVGALHACYAQRAHSGTRAHAHYLTLLLRKRVEKIISMTTSTQLSERAPNAKSPILVTRKTTQIQHQNESHE
jgi:hypothetical protein